MSDPVWYRSLYWRIALGFVLCVTGLLVAQALLFLWLAERSGASLLARSPQHLAVVVASDIGDALESDAHSDIQRSLHDQYGSRPDRIIVVMQDGRIFQNDTSTPPPEWAVRAARFRLLYHRFTDDELGNEPPPSSSERDRAEHDRAERHGNGMMAMPMPPPRRMPFGVIQVRGDAAGVVLVIPARREPYPFLHEFGPTLAAAGGILLLAGTATMAFFVFQPARRRLR